MSTKWSLAVDEGDDPDDWHLYWDMMDFYPGAEQPLHLDVKGDNNYEVVLPHTIAKILIREMGWEDKVKQMKKRAERTEEEDETIPTKPE